MGGDHRGGKRHRHGDGGHHRGGRGGGFRPPPLSAADRELREMRDAIIHCDGSPEMTRNLAGLLANDLPALNEPATRFLLECVEELPVKTPVYAALLGLLNRTSPEFAEEAVGAVVRRLEERLGSNARDDQTRAKLLTRFLTMLPQVGVVKPSAAIDVLDALVCAAGDAADIANAKKNSRQNSSGDARTAAHLWQPRSDFLVGCALAATPWCGASFAASTEPGAADAFDALLASVEEYLAKRNRRGPDPSAMTFGAAAAEDAASGAGSSVSLADDWLEETFGRVNETRRAGRTNPEAWLTASVPALLSAFPEFSTEALTSKDETRVPPPTKVPFLSFASVSEALAAYPVRPRLRILSQKMTEGLWEAGDWGPLERFVAEEYIADTLWAFEPGFRRGAIIPAAEQLGTLPLPGDHPERCQFLVAETLFGEMLALPAPRHAPVFYHVVIQDLCAAIPTFPKMMAKVVGQMFAQIARMDVEARERLADWMAHHLSCFDLAWPWKSWAHVAAQDKRHPQRRFCESVVKRLCRSCFQKRVQDSLPDELRDALMPAYASSSNGAGAPGLNARYLETLKDRTRFVAKETGAETDALTELGDLLRRKTSASEIVAWFESSGARETLGDATCAETLTAAALRHGQKCLTHHDVLLKRYAPALVEFSLTNKGAGAAVVAAASGVWSGTHPRMAVAATSRAVALNIVAPSAVAAWLETCAFDFREDVDEQDPLSATRWGDEDAFEMCFEAVGARVAAARHTDAVADDAETRRREAERAASAAEAAREDAEQRDALTQRDQFARTAQAHRDRALAFEREREAAEGPAAAARRAAAEAAAAAGAALARGVARMKGAEAAAARLRGASATGKDAGRDAAPETRAYRAMALAAAALRRMRDVGGAALESATLAAATAAGAGEATLSTLGEAVCGPGGFDAAATVSVSVSAGDDVVAMAE